MLTRNPMDGQMWRDRLLLTGNPAAGAQLSIAVHANARSELLNVTFDLTTDANAANRTVYIEIKRATQRHRIGSAGFAHTANTSYQYIVTQMSGTILAVPVNDAYIPIGSHPVLWPDDTIEIRVANIQVGDQLSTILSMWKIWPYEAI